MIQTLTFHKYHGTGNDFILMDNRAGEISLSKEQIAFLCHRRFGIGADGLMLLEAVPGADFRMVYYNSDGSESTMCGNGGRCIVAFAKALGIIDNKALFNAIDGAHNAVIEETGIVKLQMQDVSGITYFPEGAVLDTGSPHIVQWSANVAVEDVMAKGRRIRNEARFAPGGINVNFAEPIAHATLRVRTYERGVEDETLSCGTGVTAVAIAASGSTTGLLCYKIHTLGGQLQVSFKKEEAGSATNVWLSGPAAFVYRGEVNVDEESALSACNTIS